MADVYDIKIESDERGFELVLMLDEGVSSDMHTGHLRVNIHAVAEQLYNAAKREIGPWLAERDEARENYHRHDPYADEDQGPWPGESVQSYYERTGQDGPLREVADALNKARKEAGA